MQATILSDSPSKHLGNLDSELSRLSKQIGKDSEPQVKIDSALANLSKEYDECSKDLKTTTDIETKKGYTELAASLGPNIELLKKSKERISTTVSKLVNLKKSLADISAFNSSMAELAGQDALEGDVRDILKESLNRWGAGSASKPESNLSNSSKAESPDLQPRIIPVPSPIKSPDAKNGKDLKIPELGLELIYVQKGDFLMGSDVYYCEQPILTVSFTKPFWIGKYEVTQGQWKAVMGNNPSRFKGDSLPVDSVKWDECVSFCKKLSAREQKSGRLLSGYVYRLPTEEEWEYAARGGNNGKGFTYSGSNDLEEVAWYSENSMKATHPVGQKKANELGLYDMSGNVMERCHDDDSPPSSVHVCRGGSWKFGAMFCRSTYPLGDNYDNESIGFRLVLGYPLP